MTRPRSWIEIDTKALVHNARVFRRVIEAPSTGSGQKPWLMAVVKSNAYGHGLVECAKVFALRSLGGAVDYFGVDDIDEALELRKAGIGKPILVLGYTLSERFIEATKKNISITISSLDSLRHCLHLSNCSLRIHLKLETGLNRQGIMEDELPACIDILKLLQMLKCCEVEGIYSHFAAAELADQKKYKDYCNLQMDRFEKMAKMIEGAICKSVIKHMAGTAATLLLPRSRYDLVRVGIGMYGLDPTSDPKLPIVNKFKLKTALSWYSIISQVKDVKKGERVGYNLTERLKRDSRLAIVPIGYWHGYPRSAFGGSGDRLKGGLALVRDVKCKIVGLICMDMMIIDVTDVPKVKFDDVVTLIGKGLSAESVATRAGTINYELVTRINSIIERIRRN
ncbi:MAG TPA: alanine racemase [Candidatus Paceibacterota bacterium]